MKKLFISLFLSIIAIAAYAVQPVDETKIVDNLDNYIEQVRQAWKIPGMSVSVMKDGELVLQKGYGVKNLDTPEEAVGTKTLFQIGSVSKSFTAAVLATLVDEGKLSWEDTVKNILPDFEMYDPWVTEHMQVKDITTHHTGLYEQAGTYIPNLGYDGDDIYRMLKFMKPVYTFRGEYQYNNITFLIASQIIRKLTGMEWDEAITERIFKPLGMDQSCIGGDAFKAAADYALPYGFEFEKDHIKIEPLYGDEQALWWLTVIGPAGGLCCPTEDLIKWAEFHRNNGKVDGKQIISEKQMNYLHRGQTITTCNDDMIRLYGHCWFIEQSKKGRLYFHTGTVWGHTTICLWHPELGLSMCINMSSEVPSDPRYAIMRRAIDLYLGLPDHDYNKEYLDSWMDRHIKAAEKAEAEKKVEEVIPAPKAKAIVGTYVKEEPFGEVVIGQDGDKLYITIGSQRFTRELNHINGNKYNFRCDGYGFDVEFTFSEKGKRADGFILDFNGGEDFGGWTRKK